MGSCLRLLHKQVVYSTEERPKIYKVLTIVATRSAPLFHSLKIIKLQDMLHSSKSTFSHKAITKLSPVEFHNYYTPNSSVHSIRTRLATRGDLFLALGQPVMDSKHSNVLDLNYGILFHFSDELLTLFHSFGVK